MKYIKMFLLTMLFVCSFSLVSFADSIYTYATDENPYYYEFTTLEGAKRKFTFTTFSDGNVFGNVCEYRYSNGIYELYSKAGGFESIKFSVTSASTNCTELKQYLVSNGYIDNVGGEGTIPPLAVEGLTTMVGSTASLLASVGCLILSLMLLPNLVKRLLSFLV